MSCDYRGIIVHGVCLGVVAGGVSLAMLRLISVLSPGISSLWSFNDLSLDVIQEVGIHVTGHVITVDGC